MGDVAQTPEGLVTVQSQHGPVGTLMRLENSIASRGLTIFARIDHAAGAKDVGMDLRPTQVLIFGSPKSGTPLMQMSETIGIDLPLKMLVRQERIFFRNIPLSNWVEQEIPISEGADLDMLARTLSVFSPDLLIGPTEEDGRHRMIR